MVVNEEEEEDSDDAYERGEKCVKEFCEACAAQNVAVRALYGIEGEPSGRHKYESEPEVAVVEKVGCVSEARMLECEFSEEEEEGPCKHG